MSEPEPQVAPILGLAPMCAPGAEAAAAARLQRPDLSVRLGPLQLGHPLINASGTMEIFDLADMAGPAILEHPPVAAYVPKTILLEPREGNPPPRILESAGGMINSIGLSGEGLEAFVSERLPRLLTLPCPLILSIGGFSLSDYAAVAAGLRGALEQWSAGWTAKAGLEANISCPNVHSGCASIGSDPGETHGVMAAIREVWPGLLVAKLTPNVTDIGAIARAAVAGGADAIAAVNTYKGLVIDRKTLRPFLGNMIGGVSGPAIKPLALRVVYELFRSVEVPLIGMGGVAGVQDALDFMACGARVVAVGSAAFRDPWIVQDIADGLAGELASRGLRMEELVGLAHRKLISGCTSG
jgi:dihydroorotate dehydrogenase (NAD+) catalytic subunit